MTPALSILSVCSYLPRRIGNEIERLRSSRSDACRISEIRLRFGGRCAVTVDGEERLLFSSVSREEMAETVDRLCRGSLYAYRDTIGEGYLSLDGGIRVGLSGHARYDGDRLIGISDVSSLAFRLPGDQCDTEDELLTAFCEREHGGMMIYSPPGVGKTTALRALARRLGSGRRPLRVAVIDERCECRPEEFSDTTVDLLRGYRRAEGIALATRTLSPDVIAVDEIGRPEEADAILGVIGSGVPLIATAHAGTLSELLGRACVAPLIDGGAFGVFAGIRREGGTRVLCVDHIGRAAVCRS